MLCEWTAAPVPALSDALYFLDGGHHGSRKMTRSADYDDKTDEAFGRQSPFPAGATVLEPNEARQGVTHQNVRMVLGFGLAGAVIVLAIAWIAFFGFAGSSPS